VARLGEARVSLPGGCAIGARPVNLHIKALQDLGAEVDLKDGYVEAKPGGSRGDHLFRYRDGYGNGNIMMAACLAEGKTTLKNAAREPEVVNLAEVLNAMGRESPARGRMRYGSRGTRLEPAEATVIPDRIEAGTYMIAAGMTGGDVRVLGCNPAHLDALTVKLKDAGMKVTDIDGGMRVQGGRKIRSVDIKTLPYPGFSHGIFKLR